jgi:NADPH:quinone reductase-like Zn-dependent oxidoreductase
VNPIDWIMQDQDLFEIDYPSIFGQDVAGEIVEVGENSDFRVGQRVIAYAHDLHIYMYQGPLLTSF